MKLRKDEIIYIADNYTRDGAIILAKKFKCKEEYIQQLVSRLRKSGIKIPKRYTNSNVTKFNEAINELKKKSSFRGAI